MHNSGAVAGCQATTSLERSRRIRHGKRSGVIDLVFTSGFLVDERESLESTMQGIGEKVLMSAYADVEVRFFENLRSFLDVRIGKADI